MKLAHDSPPTLQQSWQGVTAVHSTQRTCSVRNDSITLVRKPRSSGGRSLKLGSSCNLSCADTHTHTHCYANIHHITRLSASRRSSNHSKSAARKATTTSFKRSVPAGNPAANKPSHKSVIFTALLSPEPGDCYPTTRNVQLQTVRDRASYETVMQTTPSDNPHLLG